MSQHGTESYQGAAGLPPLVARAVAVAVGQGFPYSCRIEQGRLLQALAGGAERIAETGTGRGVGLARLATGARPGARLLSVERDPGRARLAAEVFAGDARVAVRHADWRVLAGSGPFDLLVLDGGGGGKTPRDEPADPEALLAPGGTVVIDDFTPDAARRSDAARASWLGHPALRAVELRLAPDPSSIVGVRTGA